MHNSQAPAIVPRHSNNRAAAHFLLFVSTNAYYKYSNVDAYRTEERGTSLPCAHGGKRAALRQRQRPDKGKRNIQQTKLRVRAQS